MNIKQTFIYLDNKEVPRDLKYNYCEKFTDSELEELYAECIEKKTYITLLDDAKISYPLYPNAMKILQNAIEIRQHMQLTEQKQQTKKVIQQDKKQDLEKKWIERKAEQERQKAAAVKKKRLDQEKKVEAKNQTIIHKIEKIIELEEPATDRVRKSKFEVLE